MITLFHVRLFVKFWYWYLSKTDMEKPTTKYMKFITWLLNVPEITDKKTEYLLSYFLGYNNYPGYYGDFTANHRDYHHDHGYEDENLNNKAYNLSLLWTTYNYITQLAQVYWWLSVTRQRSMEGHFVSLRSERITVRQQEDGSFVIYHRYDLDEPILVTCDPKKLAILTYVSTFWWSMRKEDFVKIAKFI